MRWSVAKFVAIGTAGIGLFVVATGVLSLVTMLLWNALVPSLFKGPPVTFVQAVGLLLLSHILLRGFSPWRHGNGWRRERWKRRFEEKLRAMSPEEREQFRKHWHGRCGWTPGPDPGPAGAREQDQKPGDAGTV